MPVDPIIYTKDGLDVYVKPQAGHTYCMVCDVAKGVGGDYSAFVILDISQMPYKMVGKYRNNQISPLLYPSVLYRVGKEYNEAYVLIEINSSEQVAECIVKLKTRFLNHRIIDITEKLTETSYKPFQIANYNDPTIMIAEKAAEMILSS